MEQKPSSNLNSNQELDRVVNWPIVLACGTGTSILRSYRHFSATINNFNKGTLQSYCPRHGQSEPVKELKYFQAVRPDKHPEY